MLQAFHEIKMIETSKYMKGEHWKQTITANFMILGSNVDKVNYVTPENNRIPVLPKKH